MMTPELLGRALGEAPDPELARMTVSRMGERPAARALLARPDIIPAAARLLGFSTAAADFFLSHPEELSELADVSPRTQEALTEELRKTVDAVGLEPGLRRFRRRASYRTAAWDLGGASVEEVMLQLSSIAEACIQVTARSLADGEGVAVVGLGKLGGRELNYFSDVDVIFVHRALGPEEQERASRFGATLIAALSHPTADGVALRVDAALRPEGRAGPLSRSLDSCRQYYGKHAATWELQALLKARPVGGDLDLGAEFARSVVPFVYPAILPASAIDDVRATKARIEEHVRAAGKEAVELKRGRGGIRDVEFAVQLLQLVHGRRDERLRRPNTLEALFALAEEGFVAPADASALADSYRFLRRLEHRLQMARDLQTHELPADRRAVGPLARAMGLGGPDQLRAEYVRHTERVRGLHERLFYRPLLEAFGGAGAGGPAGPRPGTDRAATEELLSAMGFAEPASAYDLFARVVDPGTRLGKVLRGLFPVVTPALAFAALPDAALIRFARVVEGWAGNERLPDLLADRPDAARRLAALVGVSSAFSDALVARPALAAAVADLPAPERPLFAGDAQAELVRVAGAFAAGDLRVPEAGRRLSSIADGLLTGALAEVTSRGPPMAIMAFGKLGGEELSFASDLDVMFVYEGEGQKDFEEASRGAEAVLSRVRISGWQVDADLRPEGRSGPLTKSMASYLEYWERWAETWEYQALLRARFVAGDESLGRRFLSNAADFAYPESLSLDQVVAIRRMRVRMEEERVRPPDARRFHFKLGYGSLADVQFAVELSLMRHGFAHPEVRRTHTLEALEALSAARLLEDSVARSLADAYVFLSEIKGALELERRLPVESLPPAPEAQAALARRLGYGDRARQRLLEDYRRITRKARLAMERVFYGEDE